MISDVGSKRLVNCHPQENSSIDGLRRIVRGESLAPSLLSQIKKDSYNSSSSRIKLQRRKALTYKNECLVILIYQRRAASTFSCSSSDSI
jgi:hypothetical protein